jgi:hypothetical protein
MSERDDKAKQEPRADYLQDFPEEFEQRPDGPARDLARRERAEQEDATPTGEDSVLARIEAMKRRVRELAEEPE